VSGTATALVVATGRQPRSRHCRAPVDAPARDGVRARHRQFALLIMRTVFFLVLFVSGGRAPAHAFLESLLFAVALAVA